eukprot:scaffold52594_cov19-Tisochrysis_lutea.AAC.5
MHKDPWKTSTLETPGTRLHEHTVETWVWHSSTRAGCSWIPFPAEQGVHPQYSNGHPSPSPPVRQAGLPQCLKF